MGHRSIGLYFISLLYVLLLNPVEAVKVSLAIAPSPTVVRGHRVHISCYVDGLFTSSMFRFTLYLYCPAFTQKSRVPCFQDCTDGCSFPGCPQRRFLSQFTCLRYASGDSLTYEYSLPKVNDQHEGDYMCSFFGHSSSILRLRVLDPAPLKPPTTSSTLTPTTSLTKVKTTSRSTTITHELKSTTAPVHVWTQPSWRVTRVPKKPDVRLHGGGRDRSRGGRGIRKTGNVQGLLDMGEKLLLVVVLLFIVSLAINSVFCIRCVLIYFYGSDDWRQIKMGSLLCMSEEIRVFRDMKTSESVTYTSLGPEYSKPPFEPPEHVVPLMVAHPSNLQRQHSAPMNTRNSYHQYLNRSHPGSQHSDGDSNSSITNKSAGPRVMRVVSEIQLQPGEELDETTVMYVPLPVVVQRNGSIPKHETKPHARRPVSVVIAPGQDGQLTSKPRLSTSVSGIDRLRRSSQDSGHRILSMESVFEMEPLRE